MFILTNIFIFLPSLGHSDSSINSYTPWYLYKRGTTEKPLRLPTGDLTRTSRQALGVLLESHFLGTKINRRLERFVNSTKIGANSVDRLIARKLTRENRWLVPGGIYPICLQNELDLIIKYSIKVYRGSVTHTETMEGCQSGSYM